MMAADASMISPVSDKQTEQIAQKATIPSTDLEITADDDAAHEAAVSKFQKSVKGVWTKDRIFVDPIKEDDLERLQRLSAACNDGFSDTIIDVYSDILPTMQMPIIMFAALSGSPKCFNFLEQLEANLSTSISLLHGSFTIDLDCMAFAVLSGRSEIWKELQQKGLPLFNNLGVWFTANLVRDCRMFAYLRAI